MDITGSKKSTLSLLEFFVASLGSFQREQDLQNLLIRIKGVRIVSVGSGRAFVLADLVVVSREEILQTLIKAKFHPEISINQDGLSV